jgi:hypothetical protein
MGDNVIYICYIYNIYFTIIRAYTSTRVHIRATYIGYIYRTSIRVCIYRFMKKPYTGIRRSLHIKFGHLLTLFTQLCLCECVSVCVLHLHTHMQGGSRSIPSSKLCSPHAHHIHTFIFHMHARKCAYITTKTIMTTTTFARSGTAALAVAGHLGVPDLEAERPRL